jgi:hypothetical protein
VDYERFKRFFGQTEGVQARRRPRFLAEAIKVKAFLAEFFRRKGFGLKTYGKYCQIAEIAIIVNLWIG